MSCAVFHMVCMGLIHLGMTKSTFDLSDFKNYWSYRFGTLTNRFLGLIVYKNIFKTKKNSQKNFWLWRPLAPQVIRGSLWPNGQSCSTRWNLSNDMYVVTCYLIVGNFYGQLPQSLLLVKVLFLTTDA